MQNSSNIIPHTQKNSKSSSEISGGIQLRSDIILPSGVITSIRSPFGDEREVMSCGEEGIYRDGIKVHKTVDVNSDEDSELNTPRSIESNKSDQDMV